jgi:polysaccharide biosynthesis/export protein
MEHDMIERLGIQRKDSLACTPDATRIRRLHAAAAFLAILLSATSQVVQGAAPPSGRSPEELRRMAQQLGYTPEQMRAAAQSQEAPEALQKSPPAMPAPEVEKALAPETTRPDTRSPAPAPAQPDASQPFGYEVFRYSPTTFEPLAYGPVAPDYPLGPGDELVLTMWGDAQLALTATVNREGAVVLPDVGTIPVNGLTLEGARSRIRAVLSRSYAGLRATGPGSTLSLDLSLGKLRSIQVFLLGEVVKPGGYTVSSVSRVLNALYVAGGATRPGSLRDVRLIRGGQVIAHVDLYRLLLTGDAADETRLQNGDVVFVPPVGRRVKVSGPLRRNAIFELKEGENLAALLRMAGGPQADADLSRAQITRVVPPSLRDSLHGQDRLAIDVPLAAAADGSAPDVPLCDADELVAYSIGQERRNTVTISGLSVLKPGLYEYRPGLRLRDLLELAGGLKPEAFLGRAQLTRTAADRTRSVLRVDLSRALAGDPHDDLALEPLDAVDVLSKWDVEERGHVSIDGLVRHPGEYEYLEGMTLADLVFQAGGLTDDALVLSAELARVILQAQGTRIADTLRVPLERTLSADSRASSFALERWDAVFVRRDPQFREQVFVSVDGEVRFPGRYALTRRDERILDLVKRAGGLTEFAYAPAASFSRSGAARLGIDLPAVLHNPRSPSNLVLESSDVLRVPRFTPTVTIEGAVFNPVTALYRAGAGVGYYVTQANGYRRDADRRRTVVVQANGNVQKGGTPGPGSRVLVPARPPAEQKDHLKDFATLMTVLASAATTVYLVHQGSK